MPCCLGGQPGGEPEVLGRVALAFHVEDLGLRAEDIALREALAAAELRLVRIGQVLRNDEQQHVVRARPHARVVLVVVDLFGVRRVDQDAVGDLFTGSDQPLAHLGLGVVLGAVVELETLAFGRRQDAIFVARVTRVQVAARPGRVAVVLGAVRVLGSARFVRASSLLLQAARGAVERDRQCNVPVPQVHGLASRRIFGGWVGEPDRSADPDKRYRITKRCLG